MNNEDIIISPGAGRDERIPPGQHLVEQLPTLHHGRPPKIDISKWTLTISGDVEKKRILNYDQFTALPCSKVLSDIHCVTGWSKLNNLWEGVSTEVIRRLVRVLPQAGFVMVHAEDDFTANLSFDDFFATDALLAVKLDGEPLNREHGFPVRLVVPRLYFWKSVKWVTGIEFMMDDRPGFWESRGYHNHGDPWKQERLSQHQHGSR